jgi:methionine-S-sulfoxide reductase
MTNANKDIILGGGCFWCLEAAYLQLRGIVDVENGYAGGKRPNPTYEQVCSGATGHAEVVRLTYNQAEITLDQILEVFWIIHNPTTLNQQGYDIGTEYRSIIFYENDAELECITSAITHIAPLWPDPIVTQVVPLEAFYRAEEYHQRFFQKNPSQAYCVAIINPKLAHLRQAYGEHLIDQA